ncbi:MAG: hypothetical protein ABF265_06055 [Polaribacter sp.]
MSKTTSNSRRSRRAQMKAAGMLRVKNTYSYFSGPRQAWYAKTQEDGKAAQEANEKRTNDSIEEQLQAKLNNLKETWAEIGYNSEEIEMLNEAFILLSVKNKDTLRSDKKEARKLMKDAKTSLMSR